MEKTADDEKQIHQRWKQASDTTYRLKVYIDCIKRWLDAAQPGSGPLATPRISSRPDLHRSIAARDKDFQDKVTLKLLNHNASEPSVLLRLLYLFYGDLLEIDALLKVTNSKAGPLFNRNPGVDYDDTHTFKTLEKKAKALEIPVHVPPGKVHESLWNARKARKDWIAFLTSLQEVRLLGF